MSLNDLKVIKIMKWDFKTKKVILVKKKGDFGSQKKVILGEKGDYGEGDFGKGDFEKRCNTKIFL